MKNDEIDITAAASPSSTNVLCSSPVVASAKNSAVVGSVTDAEKKSQEKALKKFVHENRSKLIQERIELEKQRLLNEIKMSEEKAEKKRRLLDEERSRRSSALREREQQRVASAAERRRQLEQEKLAAKKIAAANDASTATSAPPTTTRTASANLMTTSMIVTSFTPRFSARTSHHDQKPGGSTPRGLTLMANGQLKTKMSVDNLNGSSSTTPTASAAAAVVAKVSSPAHRQSRSSTTAARNRDSMAASMYVAPAKNAPLRHSVLTPKESDVETSKKSAHKLSRPSTTAKTKSMKNAKSSQQLKVDDELPKIINSENTTEVTKKSTKIDENFLPNNSKVGNLSREIDNNLLDTKIENVENLQSTEIAPDNDEIAQLKSSDSASKLIDNDNGASTKKGAVMTEDEARQALTERRRLAREQADREKELERQRLETEKAAEEVEFRRQEEEELRFLRQAQQAEVERFREAQEKQKIKMEEEQLEKQRVEMEKLKSIEIDRKNKELAEKQEKEREEKMKQDELDRLERKKKLDEIRRRTRINQTPSYNSITSSVAPLTNGDEVTVTNHNNFNNQNNNSTIEIHNNAVVHQSDSTINGEKLNLSTSMNSAADNSALHEDIVNANQSIYTEEFSHAENVIKITSHDRDDVAENDNCSSSSSHNDDEIVRQKLDNSDSSPQNSTTTDRKDANLNDIVAGLNNVTLQQRQNDQLKKESYLADDSPNQTLIEF